jgi:hypothetical protein
LAIQLPVGLVWIRKRIFEALQVVGIAPIEPENVASPFLFSATGPVLIIRFAPGGATMHIIVPTTVPIWLGGVPIWLPPASTNPLTPNFS